MLVEPGRSEPAPPPPPAKALAESEGRGNAGMLESHRLYHRLPRPAAPLRGGRSKETAFGPCTTSAWTQRERPRCVRLASAVVRPPGCRTRPFPRTMRPDQI